MTKPNGVHAAAHAPTVIGIQNRTPLPAPDGMWERQYHALRARG